MIMSPSPNIGGTCTEVGLPACVDQWTTSSTPTQVKSRYMIKTVASVRAITSQSVVSSSGGLRVVRGRSWPEVTASCVERLLAGQGSRVKGQGAWSPPGHRQRNTLQVLVGPCVTNACTELRVKTERRREHAPGAEKRDDTVRVD